MVDILNKWKTGLERTRKATFGRLRTVLGASEVTAETWDELDMLLIQADLGIKTTQEIIEALKIRVVQDGIVEAVDLQITLREELLNRLLPIPDDAYHFNAVPYVILLVGVNGSGKTTTAAKLGKQFQDQGKKVLLVAADTFRAAAIDQLQVWGERLHISVIAGQPNSDPGAVAFDGIQAAISRNAQIVIIDSAGRLHTRSNLMEELKKIYRVSGKAHEGAPHATWLVLDSTTGQNAIAQARAFRQAVNINGVILAKLDSSAKGGMAFAIQQELNVPILYAGLGEKPEDIQPFDRDAFVDGILSK